MQLKEIVKSVRTTWVDTLMKVIVYPFLVMFLFSLWPVAHNVRNAVILVSAMPVAVNAFIVARGMNMDHKYAADLVAASTFASILIVPFWLLFCFKKKVYKEWFISMLVRVYTSPSCAACERVKEFSIKQRDSVPGD